MNEGFRKWFWRSAGFGAGAVLMLAILTGAVIWWVDRPKPPKPWNTKAIRAEYDYVSTAGDKNNIEFYYTLINDTDLDYRVSGGGDVDLSVKLGRENSISQPSKGDDNSMKGDFPIFVPAHGRARFGIHIAYPYSEKYDDKATDDEKHDWGTTLAKYITSELNNIDGFVMFDSVERYEVAFPSGWKDRAKEQLRVKSPKIDFQPLKK
jgi:hypothetical protein